MPSIEALLHGALMARVESLALSPALPILWGLPADRPAGEHVQVDHLPNRNTRHALDGSSPQDRMGILQLTLFSPPGAYVWDYQNRAGLIAAHFPLDLPMTQGGVTIRVTGASVGQSRPDGAHVLTAVSIEYRGFA